MFRMRGYVRRLFRVQTCAPFLGHMASYLSSSLICVLQVCWSTNAKTVTLLFEHRSCGGGCYLKGRLDWLESSWPCGGAAMQSIWEWICQTASEGGEGCNHGNDSHNNFGWIRAGHRSRKSWKIWVIIHLGVAQWVIFSLISFAVQNLPSRLWHAGTPERMLAQSLSRNPHPQSICPPPPGGSQQLE